MKRDMDLVRDILRVVAERGAYDPERDPEAIQRHDTRTILEHIQMMDEKGLVVATLLPSSAGITAAVVHRLTWAGHDFLELSKNDRIWAKAKELAASRGLGLTIEALTEILKMLVHKSIESIRAGLGG